MAIINILGGQVQLGAGAISDAHINSAAAIAVTKMQHAYYLRTNYQLKAGDAPVTAEYIVHQANSAGTVLDFKAMLNTAATAGSVTFDLKKNGTSILTAVITIDNTIAAKVAVAATIATPSFVAGDVFIMSAVASGATSALGPLSWMGFSETTSP